MFSLIQRTFKMKLLLFVLSTIGLLTLGHANLQSDLNEFVDILPLAEIQDVATYYLQNDEEFQTVVTYLQGQDWANLVSKIEEHLTWQQFEMYLREAGIDVDGINKWFHYLISNAKVPEDKPKVPQKVIDFLGQVAEHKSWNKFTKKMAKVGLDVAWLRDMVDAGEQAYKYSKDIRGIKNFMDTIFDMLPVDKIIYLINEKLQSSEDFARLFEKLTSSKAHQLLEDVRALPEVHRIVDRLLKMGIDVHGIFDYIYGFLG